MKSLPKVTRLQLKVDQDDEHILLGIVSPEPDYKLSLSLNRRLKLSLKNSSPLKVSDDKGNDLTFSRFSDTSGAPDISFNLISNRSGNNFLLKKLKNIDYLLSVRDPDIAGKINNITASLREIDSVTAVFNIDISSIKDKNLQDVIQ
jgi:hypothetical protein